jgi:hypothetical protein
MVVEIPQINMSIVARPKHTPQTVGEIVFLDRFCGIQLCSMDEYVAARIAGEQSNQFLDNLEAYVAVDLCRNIGRFAKEHRPADQAQSVSTDISDVENGFAIASQGMH